MKGEESMRKFLLVILAAMLISGCATMKYEPPKLDLVKKIPEYKLPEDPFVAAGPPVPLFLKKDTTGKWIECSKEEAIVIAYIPKEHDKIVLRIQYLKDINAALVRLVNIHIDITNVKSELERDQLLRAEIYKEMWTDAVNQGIISKTWNDVEKGGLTAIIIVQIIAILGLAL